MKVQNKAFAGTRIDQKTCEPENSAQREPTGLFGQRAKGDCSDGQLDLPGDPCFNNFRLVFENEIGCWDAGGRVAKRTGLGDARCQVNAVH
jgi:hypothetical protein